MKTDLIIIKEKPVIPENWDYNDSVIKCNNLFKKVREIGAEALTEFYIAYIILIEDSKKKIGRKYPDKTFEGYCNDIGINKKTGFEWLHKYFNLPRRIVEKVTIPLPEGRYNVLLADPPWTYKNTGVNGAVDKEYPTLTIEEIEEYTDNEGKKIKELPADDAVLFLWVTNPILEECFPVIESWGFSYKSNFCWVKKNKKTGIGFYVRGVHELLLICIKGKGSMLPDYTPLSVIEEEARGHSKKPEIYDLIERMYPGQTYIELFARKIKKEERRIGWTYWGAEV